MQREITGEDDLLKVKEIEVVFNDINYIDGLDHTPNLKSLTCTFAVVVFGRHAELCDRILRWYCLLHLHFYYVCMVCDAATSVRSFVSACSDSNRLASAQRPGASRALLIKVSLFSLFVSLITSSFETSFLSL